MLRVSRLTDYSTVLMSYMARQPLAVHSAAKMAAATGMTLPTASKILKTLTRRRLLLSLPGMKGGYCLARPPEQISVADVVAAMEGPLGLTECSVTAGRCGREADCPLRPQWQGLSRWIFAALEDVSVADMGAATGLEGGAEVGAEVRGRGRPFHRPFSRPAPRGGYRFVAKRSGQNGKPNLSD